MYNVDKIKGEPYLTFNSKQTQGESSRHQAILSCFSPFFFQWSKFRLVPPWLCHHYFGFCWEEKFVVQRRPSLRAVQMFLACLMIEHTADQKQKSEARSKPPTHTHLALPAPNNDTREGAQGVVESISEYTLLGGKRTKKT